MLLCSVWTPTTQRTSFILKRTFVLPHIVTSKPLLGYSGGFCAVWYLPVDLPPLSPSTHLDSSYFKIFKWYEKSNVRETSAALCINAAFTTPSVFSSASKWPRSATTCCTFPQLNNIWTCVNSNRTIIWNSHSMNKQAVPSRVNPVQIKANPYKREWNLQYKE